MIVPVGLLGRLGGMSDAKPRMFAIDTKRSERLAMEAVMATERKLGYAPRDMSDQNVGYDIESAITGTGLLRFIEVKGRVKGAKPDRPQQARRVHPGHRRHRPGHDRGSLLPNALPERAGLQGDQRQLRPG